MLRGADARGYGRVVTMSPPRVNDQAARVLAERGFTYEGYDEARRRHRWTSRVTDLVNIEVCFYPHGDFCGRAWTAGKFYTEFGETLAAEYTREVSEHDLGRTLLRLYAEAILSRLCGDCGVPVVTPWPIFRPRESEHAVCDGCAKLYRNCAVCGEETRHRVCDWCSCACFVKSNFPDSLTPAQRVWFTIMYSFSIFGEPGSAGEDSEARPDQRAVGEARRRPRGRHAGEGDRGGRGRALPAPTREGFPESLKASRSSAGETRGARASEPLLTAPRIKISAPATGPRVDPRRPWRPLWRPSASAVLPSPNFSPAGDTLRRAVARLRRPRPPTPGTNRKGPRATKAVPPPARQVSGVPVEKVI